MQKIDESKFTVYLSSTKYSIFNYKSYTWKDKFMNMTWDILGCDVEFYDPIKDYYSDDYKMACPEDLDAISKCNFVVVYIDKVTIGTMLELGLCLFSEKYKKPYGVLTFNKKVYNHPWLSYLCDGENKCMYDNYIDLIIDKMKKPYIKWWSTNITKGM